MLSVLRAALGDGEGGGGSDARGARSVHEFTVVEPVSEDRQRRGVGGGSDIASAPRYNVYVEVLE